MASLTPETVIKLISNLIAAVAAVALLAAGLYVALSTDKTATTGYLLAFAFLFVVLLSLAKFRRFKAWGFEAEMWETKQEEAAAIINGLEENLKELAARREKIRANVKARIIPDGPPGHMTAEVLQNLLLEMVEALDVSHDIQQAVASQKKR
jgi:hypothetical protein